MTYDARERSVQDGAPVEVYEFARNAKLWRFTSAEADLTFEGDDYTSIPITRTAIESSNEQARNALSLTVPRNLEVAALFRISPPTDVIAITVRRFHRSEEGDVAVVWIGRVLNVSFEGAKATMSCEPVSVSVKRQGLRRLYQKQCPHALYGPLPGCGVDMEDHRHDTTVTSISDVTVQVGSLLSKPYAGGFIQYEDVDGNFERRFIRSFTGTTLTINFPFQGLSPSDPVTVYPGCDHTMETCDTVYVNLPNYGGWPYTPHKNPFDGTPVY